MKTKTSIKIMLWLLFPYVLSVLANAITSLTYWGGNYTIAEWTKCNHGVVFAFCILGSICGWMFVAFLFMHLQYFPQVDDYEKAIKELEEETRQMEKQREKYTDLIEGFVE